MLDNVSNKLVNNANIKEIKSDIDLTKIQLREL